MVILNISMFLLSKVQAVLYYKMWGPFKCIIDQAPDFFQTISTICRNNRILPGRTNTPLNSHVFVISHQQSLSYLKTVLPCRNIPLSNLKETDLNFMLIYWFFWNRIFFSKIYSYSCRYTKCTYIVCKYVLYIW